MPFTPSSADSFLVAIAGDIHDQWDDQDDQAILNLGADLALFVGDFGNEAIAIVEQIAALPIPKAIALGNHDAWYTATPWGQKQQPANLRPGERVQAQLETLKETHVGYTHLDFDFLGMSVVGGRPMSWGGPWKMKEFYSRWFDVHSLEESGQRIIAALDRACHQPIIFLSHNGPTGLGEAAEDPCGRDWKPLGGDHGDPELAMAIQAAYERDRPVPLVVFGHMHHELRHRRDRLRTRLCQGDAQGNYQRTFFLNVAQVPRWKIINGETCRHFALVQFQDQQVVDIRQVWITSQGERQQEEVLFSDQSLKS
jgi:uncharacterized protein (TIGR04168 family)